MGSDLSFTWFEMLQRTEGNVALFAYLFICNFKVSIQQENFIIYLSVGIKFCLS